MSRGNLYLNPFKYKFNFSKNALSDSSQSYKHL